MNLCQVWLLKSQDTEACHGLACVLPRQHPSSSHHSIFVGNFLVCNVGHFVIQPRLQLCLLCSAKKSFWSLCGVSMTESSPSRIGILAHAPHLAQAPCIFLPLFCALLELEPQLHHDSVGVQLCLFCLHLDWLLWLLPLLFLLLFYVLPSMCCSVVCRCCCSCWWCRSRLLRRRPLLSSQILLSGWWSTCFSRVGILCTNSSSSRSFPSRLVMPCERVLSHK